MSEKELTDLQYDAELPISPEAEQTEQADMTDTAQSEEEPRETVANTRNSYGELRKLQRVMFEVAHTDPMGSARASAARVWRDLEILRLAKLGKPICLSTTAKLEQPSRKQPSSPLVQLAPPDQSQAA